MLLIEFSGTLNTLKHIEDRLPPYFVFVISGPTKGNQPLRLKLGIPSVSVTEGTHLRPGTWLTSLVQLTKADGVSRDWLFKHVS
jgi:hypothetical protein